MNGTVGGQVSRYVSRAVIFTGAEMYHVLERLFVLCARSTLHIMFFGCTDRE